jgi:hypothetical protein
MQLKKKKCTGKKKAAIQKRTHSIEISTEYPKKPL